MVVLNATGVAPIPFQKNSFSSDRRSEPKRLPSPHRPLSPSAFFFRRFSEGLASFSSVLGAASSARAFTYEDLLKKTLGSSGEFDLEGIADGVRKFSSENPLILAGGASLVVITLIVSQILGSSKAWGVKSAKDAYAKLTGDAGAQLLDIREGKEIKEAGNPDLRGLKKNIVAIAFQGEAKARFLKKLTLKFKDPGNTTLFILDKFDGNSELVAELVTTKGFKAAYAIKGGAEGARGWKNSDLPWSPPKKTLFLDFGDLRDAIEETPNSIPVTLALAAATGLGLFAFTEIETLLQLLGSAAIIQFISKKLLFAEDRKITLKQLDEFLNTKVAPKELADEIKRLMLLTRLKVMTDMEGMIGKAILPTKTSSQASPPTSVSSDASFTETKAEKNEGSPELTQAVNSVSIAELEEKAAGKPTSLSPYPYYPDFKPPASPSPSKP